MYDGICLPVPEQTSEEGECDMPTEMHDLILLRLPGRARDMAKVSLRSRSDLSPSELPLALFGGELPICH